MITGDYDYLKNLAKYNVCGEHKTPLEIAWHSGQKTWVLRCGHDHYPDMVTRQLSLTEGYKAGEDLPEPIKSNIEKRLRRNAVEQTHNQKATALTFFTQKDLATGQLLPAELQDALKEYASRYGLDPYRGHVVCMYGKPYISIDGYLYHAGRLQIRYSLTGRPMTDDELKSYGYQPGDLGYIAEFQNLDNGQEFQGIGFVTRAEINTEVPGKPGQKRYPVVSEKPGQMVQKRAEWQVLRRAVPIGETESEAEKEEERERTKEKEE